MPTDDRALLAEAMREELARRKLGDFLGWMNPSYKPARHTVAICEALEALESYDINRLMVFMPPRHGKSMHCSEAFPAWALGRNPRRQIVLSSYAAERAEDYSRHARAYLQDRERWPFDCRLSAESSAVNRWHTDAGGVVIAVGVGGGLTGFGADFLIIDDPVRGREEADSEAYQKAAREWYSDVARTRLMPKGRILLSMTRWSDADLAGEILNSRDAKNWHVLLLPAIAEEGDTLGRKPGEALWPERFPLSALPGVERDEISSRSFSALYQQSPVALEGNCIRREWLRYYDEVPASFDRVVCGLDAASKTGVANDFSAIVTLGAVDKKYYLIDVTRRKCEFPELRRMTKAIFEKYSPSAIYVEDTSSGTGLIQELRRESHLPVVAVQAKGSKLSRVEGISGTIEAGRLHSPRNAPWLAEFERELLGFPGARHDDMVDALVIALSRLRQKRDVGRTWAFAKNDPGSRILDRLLL